MKWLAVLFIPITLTSLVAADTGGWSAATLYDGKWKVGFRYDAAPLDGKGRFWISAFATSPSDRMEQTAIGWGITAKARTETGVEFGLSLGINANHLFDSQKLKGNFFVAVGVKF